MRSVLGVNRNFHLRLQFVFDALVGYVADLCRNKFGGHAIKACVDMANPKQKEVLLGELVASVVEVCIKPD